MGDSKMGLQARLDVAGAAQADGHAYRRPRPCCIFINQLRDKIGVVLRQSRNHDRRQRAEVLLPASVSISAACRSIKDGEEQLGNPHQSQGCEEQGGTPLPARQSSTSCSARASPRSARSSTSACDLRMSSRRAVRGSPTATANSDRAATRSRRLFKTDTALANEIETKVREAMKAPQQK